MRIHIEGPTGSILDVSDGSENVLLPLEEVERALAIQALVGALSLLTRNVAIKASPDATEIETVQRNLQNPRYFDDHKRGVVVPLSGPRGT
jgi:hypothetical protein